MRGVTVQEALLYPALLPTLFQSNGCLTCTDTILVGYEPNNWPVHATLKTAILETALQLAIYELSSLLQAATTVLHTIPRNEKDFERFLIQKALTR